MAVTGSITITQKSQNIADNTTVIEVIGKATMTGPSMDYNTRTGTVTINGANYSFSTNFPEKSTKTLFSKEVTIPHNSDGTKTVSASFRVTTGMTGTLSGGVLTASTSKTLSTIPRASSVTCADGNIGSSTTININRVSSAFTHTLKYTFGNKSGTIATKTSSTSIGWNIPTSFYEVIPNSKSGRGTITCETYNGNTLIGTKTCTFNAFVINSNPSVSATIQDVNTKTIALTGDSNTLVKYMSNAKVDITATAKNSATISSRKVVCGSKTGTATSNTLNNVESGTFAVSCMDSRGNTASTKITKDMVNYIKLAFTDISLTRPSTTSNTVNCILKGNYFNGNFGQVDNTMNLKYRYREAQGEWSNYIEIVSNINGNTFNYTENLGDVFDFNHEYEFEFILTDKLMSITQKVTVSRGIPIIDIGENDIVINREIFKKEKEVLAEGEWHQATLASNVEESTNGLGGAKGVQYKKIGNHVFVRGSVILTPNENSSVHIATLPYAPKFSNYNIASCTGSRIGRVFINTSGQLRVDWVLNVADGSKVTSELSWLDVRIDFWID